MKLGFWILDACVLFALSLLYLYQGYSRKNPLFTAWLCLAVFGQLVAAWGLAAGRPPWMGYARVGFDVGTYVLSIAVLALAVMRRECPVNRCLLWGMGAMLALNIFARWVGTSVELPVQMFLRNVAFLGPAIFLLISLSNLRMDQLPLWLDWALRGLASPAAERQAVASVALPEASSPTESRNAHPASS